jgi:hypothetical protein
VITAPAAYVVNVLGPRMGKAVEGALVTWMVCMTDYTTPYVHHHAVLQIVVKHTDS